MESMCSGSAEPSIRLAYVLAGQLLKFCGHAICCNAPTLNNSQNLNLDFLAASFWVQWTQAHGSAGKCLISGGNKDLCKLDEEYSNASICKFVVYFLQHFENFDVSHVFLPLTIAELSTLKQVHFFGPPCILWAPMCYFLLRTVICFLTVIVTLYSLDIPSVVAYTTFYAWNKSIGDTKMTTNLKA